MLFGRCGEGSGRDRERSERFELSYVVADPDGGVEEANRTGIRAVVADPDGAVEVLGLVRCTV
ncbi:hypothetical protein Mapa_011320 [Marchantia paleacea]|nr:hypothetical protein Mapa_011320 [Marchantia paleacea]